MTLDHIGAYQTFTFSREINDGLRVVGRIAAPLFLFMVVEGLRYTRSKPKYILRLYIAGIVIEMINRILSKATGAFEFGNTLPTFFYTALFVFSIEYICNNWRHIKSVCIGVCGLVIPFTFFALNVILLEQGYSAAWYFISLFFPSPCNVDYSILFGNIPVSLAHNTAGMAIPQPPLPAAGLNACVCNCHHCRPWMCLLVLVWQAHTTRQTKARHHIINKTLYA